MMGMYALEGGAGYSSWPSPSAVPFSSYGFLSGAGPSVWSRHLDPIASGLSGRGYPFSARTACAAARRATGTRKGEQLT